MVGIFLIFTIYGLITFDLSIQEMKKLVGARNEAFSFNIMQDLDKNIDKRLNDFKDLTKLRIVQETLKESNAEFAQLPYLDSFIEQKDLDESDISFEPFISGIAEKELSRELKEIIRFYNEQYGYDVVEELFITNEFGANVALGSGTSDFRQDDEEWWQIAKVNGIFIGDLEFQEEYGSYATPFGFRIDDEEGKFLGIMRIVLTLEDMVNEFINDAEIITIQNRNVILLDDRGRIIYSLGIQEFVNSLPIDYFKKIPASKDFGTIELTDSSDEVKIVSYAKSTGYKEFPGFGWIVLIDQSDSSFVDEFVELRNSILSVSIIGMVASVVIGLVVSFFITKPLKSLSRFAEKISKGKFDSKIKKSKIDEIEVIGESFNKMSESLKKLIETEKQLTEAQARVKSERLTTIGEIAAGMAHNMKNPLGTIRTSGEIIKRSSKGGDKEIDGVLDRMDRAIVRMSGQIEDVLNFVRVTPLHISSVSIRTLFEGALETLEIPKNILIKLPENDFDITCDAKKLEIVFMNLILNSIQAIGRAQGIITIRAKKENQNAIIEIEDSGPGISEEMLPRLFIPLTTTKEKGTGLGLSTCKNIIKQHKGSISVKNNPTTFTIVLPINGMN